jgi:hypothetical protein
MANLGGNFTGSLIVVYDQDNNYITKTVIVGHDKKDMYIELAGGLEKVRIGARLNLLIVHENGASEFGGILKILRQGRYEVSLYGEKKRDAREASRRVMNTVAVIRHYFFHSVRETLQEPVQVTIENISTTGVLLTSMHARFLISAVLELEFNLHGKSVIIHGKTLREQENDDGTCSYGCKLIFLK